MHSTALSHLACSYHVDNVSVGSVEATTVKASLTMHGHMAAGITSVVRHSSFRAIAIAAVMNDLAVIIGSCKLAYHR